MGVSLNGGTPISHTKMIIRRRKTYGCWVPPLWETLFCQCFQTYCDWGPSPKKYTKQNTKTLKMFGRLTWLMWRWWKQKHVVFQDVGGKCLTRSETKMTACPWWLGDENPSLLGLGLFVRGELLVLGKVYSIYSYFDICWFLKTVNLEFMSSHATRLNIIIWNPTYYRLINID